MNKKHLVMAAALEAAGILAALAGFHLKDDPGRRTLGFVLLGAGGAVFAAAQAWILGIVLGSGKDREG